MSLEYPKMTRLQGKVAIITGAAMGIGEAEARLFAQEGARVVATDFNTEKLRQVVNAITAAGGEAIAVRQDVTSAEGWSDVLLTTLQAFGQVDILVNNVGTLSRKSVAECTVDVWNHVQAVNATSVFLGMQAVIPAMQKQRRGSVINVSSIAGLSGSLFASASDMAYCASKWAVRGMSKFAANAYAADGIRVNSLHPGPTDTPMMNIAANPGLRAVLAQTIPLPPHLSQPVTQAYAALFLASDEADFITGIELPCDGGFSSRCPPLHPQEHP